MNINLITSTSYKLIDEQIKKIVKENNYLYMNMIDDDFSSFLEEVSYSFFMDEKKYIVIKNMFSTINEKNEEKLIKYLTKPNENCIVIFIEEKVDARKKIIKTIKSSYNYINIAIDYKNVYNYIDTYIKNNNFKSDYSFNKYLVSMYALNLDIIYTELDKIFTYFNKSVLLTKENTKDILFNISNSNNFKFVESVANKSISLSYEILNDLYLNKIDPSMLIILLAREFKLIYYVKKYTENKKRLNEISSILKTQDWQTEKYYKTSLQYSEKELVEIIKKLGEKDLEIKTGKTDKYSAIQLMLLDIFA